MLKANNIYFPEIGNINKINNLNESINNRSKRLNPKKKFHKSLSQKNLIKNYNINGLDLSQNKNSKFKTTHSKNLSSIKKHLIQLFNFNKKSLYSSELKKNLNQKTKNHLFFRRNYCKKECMLDQLISNKSKIEDNNFSNEELIYEDDDNNLNSFEKVIIDDNIIYTKNTLTNGKKKLKNNNKSFDESYIKKIQNIEFEKIKNKILNWQKLPEIGLKKKKKEGHTIVKEEFNDLMQVNKKNVKLMSNSYLKNIYNEIKKSVKGIKQINNKVNMIYDQSKNIFNMKINDENN